MSDYVLKSKGLFLCSQGDICCDHRRRYSFLAKSILKRLQCSAAMRCCIWSRGHSSVPELFVQNNFETFKTFYDSTFSRCWAELKMEAAQLKNPEMYQQKKKRKVSIVGVK